MGILWGSGHQLGPDVETGLVLRPSTRAAGPDAARAVAPPALHCSPRGAVSRGPCADMEKTGWVTESVQRRSGAKEHGKKVPPAPTPTPTDTHPHTYTSQPLDFHQFRSWTQCSPSGANPPLRPCGYVPLVAAPAKECTAVYGMRGGGGATMNNEKQRVMGIGKTRDHSRLLVEAASEPHMG